MKFTREQVIEMAREAGFDTRRESVLVDGIDISRTFTRLCTLAADRALEAAESALNDERVEDTGEDDDRAYNLAIDHGIEAIRAMKGQA